MQEGSDSHSRLVHLRLRRPFRDAEQFRYLFVIVALDVVQHERLATAIRQALERPIEIDPRDRRITPGHRVAAGFGVENFRKINIGPALGITNPHVLGNART